MATAFATMMTGEAIWAFSECWSWWSRTCQPRGSATICRSSARRPRSSARSRSCSAILVMLAGWGGIDSGRSVPRPLCSSCLAWTNPWHGLFWAQDKIDTIGDFDHAVRVYGPGGWAFVVYAYATVALSVVLLAQAVVVSAGVYRAQAVVMLFGVLVPAVIDLLDWTSLFSFIHVDTVSLSFVLTGLAFLPGLFRFHLLDLPPVAWAVVVRGMDDPVAVIDPWGRIVELNPAAQLLAGHPYPEVLGVDAARAFAHWTNLAHRLDGIRDQDEVSFELDGPDPAVPSTFNARISRLGATSGPWGWVLVLRDVTEHKRAAEERVRMLRGTRPAPRPRPPTAPRTAFWPP